MPQNTMACLDWFGLIMKLLEGTICLGTAPVRVNGLALRADLEYAGSTAPILHGVQREGREPV
jgi:hypothetical protein